MSDSYLLYYFCLYNMLIHIRYNDYVPDVEEMNGFENNIETPSKSIAEKYENKVDDIVNNIKDEYNVDSDGIHFVYGVCTNEESTTVKAFHPDNYKDWVQEPIVYIKTSVNDWEKSFDEKVSKALKDEIFYDTKF